METETVTPINDTVALLRATSPEGLLDTHAALTHRIHVARHDSLMVRDDLRQQRAMVRAELLRRMGGE